MSRDRTARRPRRTKQTSVLQGQPEFQQPRNLYSPMDIISADQLEAIHNTSLDVLENIGINFLLDDAREILERSGADTDSNSTRVRFDRGLIEESIAHTPSAFTLYARNPKHDLRFGDQHIVFSSVSSPPNASDIERGRRSGNFEDYSNFLRLAQSLNIVHMTFGHPVEPIDIDPATRHLVSTKARIELTDKCFSGYSLGHQRILDAIEMARIGRGISEQQLLEQPSIITNVNANSPLQFDIPMLWGMIELAQRRQPVVVTPFTLAGAMAPVTLAGALTQQNAEALAGLAFLQIVNPGTPAIYGGFTSNVDMKTGSPAFGTPENGKATIIGGQLARRYGIPYRSSNCNASNAPDAQAVYEAQTSIWSAVLGHVNLLKHAFGWLEGGLCASFEKYIIDAEMLQSMAEFLKPVTVNNDELAVDAIADVGPAGHFFGTAHTLERYENAFYTPLLSDWRNYETWSEDGSVTATERAHRIYKTILEEYQPPALDESISEELNGFVVKRIAEGGAPV